MSSADSSSYHTMFVFSADDSPGRRKEIHRAIDDLNRTVVQLSPSKDFSEKYIALIRKAREDAETEQWTSAHTTIWNATLLVNRAVETMTKAGLRIRLAFTPVLTFAILLLLDWLLIVLSGDGMIVWSVLRQEYVQFLWTGAVGGTTIAYWGLVKHTINLDFDDAYIIWYWFKPILGAVFGLVSVIIVKGGILVLGDGGGGVTNNLALHVVAFLAGFSERFVIQLLDRVATAVFGGGSTENSEESSQRFDPQRGHREKDREKISRKKTK